MLTRPETGWVMLIVALGLVLYGAATWSFYGAADDAYITFRYANHLVEGLGPVFNMGERVEGYTTPSWMLLMAAAIKAGVEPLLASHGLGILSALALILVLYRALRNAGVPIYGAGFACLPLASSPVLHDWSVSGMETCTFVLLFFAGIERLVRPEASPSDFRWGSILLVAATLTHPEALAFWVLGAFYAAWIGKSHLVPYAVPGVVPLAHFIWRLVFYGKLLPNTYYAKTGAGFAALPAGFEELGRFLVEPTHAIWILLAVVGGIYAARECGEGRRVALLGIVVVLQVLYVLSIGGDYIYVFRFYLPLLPLLSFLMGLLFVGGHTNPAATQLRAGLAAVLLLLAPLALWREQAHYLPPVRAFLPYFEGNEKLGRYLAENRPPHTVIAVAAAGAIPYYSGLRTIDMFGLNDATIAHQPFPDIEGGGLVKWDNAYVLSRQPDIIVINRGYFRAGDPLAEQVLERPQPMLRHRSDVDLFDRVVKDGGYRCHPIRFRDGSQFFIFERKTEI